MRKINQNIATEKDKEFAKVGNGKVTFLKNRMKNEIVNIEKWKAL